MYRFDVLRNLLWLCPEKTKLSIAENVEGFADKYRFADEDETARTDEFIAQLEFAAPGHIAAGPAGEPYEYGRMYLRFLGGSRELLRTCVCGQYSDLVSDLDSWDFLNPFLMMIADDFEHYIYFDDNGERSDSKLPAR